MRFNQLTKKGMKRDDKNGILSLCLTDLLTTQIGIFLPIMQWDADLRHDKWKRKEKCNEDEKMIKNGIFSLHSTDLLTFKIGLFYQWYNEVPTSGMINEKAERNKKMQ